MKKICKGCKIEKDIDSFYNKKTNPDGKQSVCKICTKKMLKEYRLKKKIQVNK
jgi:superfamily II helicase